MQLFSNYMEEIQITAILDYNSPTPALKLRRASLSLILKREGEQLATHGCNSLSLGRERVGDRVEDEMQ